MIGRTKDISIQKNHQDELLLGFVVVFFQQIQTTNTKKQLNQVRSQ